MTINRNIMHIVYTEFLTAFAGACREQRRVLPEGSRTPRRNSCVMHGMMQYMVRHVGTCRSIASHGAASGSVANCMGPSATSAAPRDS